MQMRFNPAHLEFSPGITIGKEYFNRRVSKT
jgi:hypothetical protein